MSHLITHALRIILRQPMAQIAPGIGIAIAAALACSVLLFGVASGSTVTHRALAGTPIDAQVVLASRVTQSEVVGRLRDDPAVVDALPFDLVHFDRATLANAGSATQTSVGVLVGADEAYRSATGLFPLSAGSFEPGRVAISRDLASNLGAVTGDTITFRLPGGASVDLGVSGIVDVTGADTILGPTDAGHRAAGANPPANVALLDPSSLESLVIPRIPDGAVPAEAPTAVGHATSPVVTGEPAVRREVQLRYDEATLPGDPVAAQRWLDEVRRRIELGGGGRFTVVDDASAALAAVAGDLAWGQILFLFLGLPGIILALALSPMALDATADSTRRHIALLRARGASRRDIGVVLLVTAAVVTLVASLVGCAIGTAIALLAFGSALTASDPLASVPRAWLETTLGIAVVALVGTAWSLRAQLDRELRVGRQELVRARPPMWRRYYLDLAALAMGAALALVLGGGLHPVLTAEGDPTVTLAATSFAAPLLLWSGGALLLLRLVSTTVGRVGWIGHWLYRAFGAAGGLAAASLRARQTAASRVLVIVALTLSFGTSVLVFEATYQQQQRVDARLTLGADVAASPMGPTTTATALAAMGAAAPGWAITPISDRVVYVGSEAQDLLAIDPQTLPGVAPLSDAWFAGTTWKDALAALAAQPDGILVSSETATDYSIVPGDRVRIRVPDAHGQLVPIDFHMLGVALEFPTAPHDAFLVANQGFVSERTGDDHVTQVLGRVVGDPSTVAPDMARRLGPSWAVTDISQVDARLANAITSVDLGGLVGLDLLFAVVIAAVGGALFLLAGLSERRRELATLIVLGAEETQLRSLLVAETTVIAAGGVAVGVTLGLLVAVSLLGILAGVFDPPADLPVVPVATLVCLAAAVALGLAVSVGVGLAGLRRMPLLGQLRER